MAKYEWFSRGSIPHVLLKYTIMTKNQLSKIISELDHNYQYSEDFNVVKNGRQELLFVMDELSKLFDKRSEQLEFYNANVPDNVSYMQSYIDELKAERN